jgi:TFIIH basal transcription factor complex TTD-A subunit
MPRAIRGVLIECDPSIKSIIVNIDSTNHDFIIEDLDEERVVVKENMVALLKQKLEDVRRLRSLLCCPWPCFMAERLLTCFSKYSASRRTCRRSTSPAPSNSLAAIPSVFRLKTITSFSAQRSATASHIYVVYPYTIYSFANVGRVFFSPLINAAGKSFVCSATVFQMVVYRRLSTVPCSRP